MINFTKVMGQVVFKKVIHGIDYLITYMNECHCFFFRRVLILIILRKASDAICHCF